MSLRDLHRTPKCTVDLINLELQFCYWKRTDRICPWRAVSLA